MAWQELGNNAQVDEGRRADLEAVRNPSALAVDVEAELSLGILRAEVDLATRGIDPLGGDDEVVDELFHALEDLLLRGKGALSIDHVDRAARDGIDGLSQDPEALAHLLDTYQIAVVAVADRTDRDLKIVFLVVEVGIRLADIVVDS